MWDKVRILQIHGFRESAGVPEKSRKSPEKVSEKSRKSLGRDAKCHEDAALCPDNGLKWLGNAMKKLQDVL
jgi:hypothetical protein